MVVHYFVTILIQNVIVLIINKIPNGMEVVVDVVVRIFPLFTSFTNIRQVACCWLGLYVTLLASSAHEHVETLHFMLKLKDLLPCQNLPHSGYFLTRRTIVLAGIRNKMHTFSRFEHCFVRLDIFQVLFMNISVCCHKSTFRFCCHNWTHFISKDLVCVSNT